MAHQALIEHRPWIVASLAASAAYYFLWNNPVGGIWLILLKGAGVGFLTIYAIRRTRGLDGALLVLVLALAAAADMVLEINFRLGGAVFLLSHLVACCLYWRQRQVPPVAMDRAVGLALLLIAPTVSYMVSGNPLIAIYALSLGLMAAFAWMSRFPSGRVGLGAILFIFSDWLIFARNGPFDPGPLSDALVWPSYYAAQLLIATGVVQTLRKSHAARGCHAVPAGA
ncbi:MAG: lysoplasmalogenase family protein [Erythrobacter sp.]|jgi:uncharacterized membrane protein YhhN|nr:lysoplasmalogenase family protein [Erythrobacter sp.]